MDPEFVLLRDGEDVGYAEAASGQAAELVFSEGGYSLFELGNAME